MGLFFLAMIPMGHNPYQALEFESNLAPLSERRVGPGRPQRERVLQGLSEVMRAEFGVKELPDLETSIRDHLQRNGRDRDLTGLCPAIERTFGIVIRPREFAAMWSGGVQDEDRWQVEIAPTRTFAWLADEITNRLNGVSLNGPEGVLSALEQLARDKVPKIGELDADTRIRSRLDGNRLEAFWKHLGYLTREELPPLRPYSILYQLGDFAVLLVSILMLLVFIGLFVKVAPKQFAQDTSIVLAIVAAGLFAAGCHTGARRLVDRIAGPLPRGVHTFGDLALLVAVGEEDSNP